MNRDLFMASINMLGTWELADYSVDSYAILQSKKHKDVQILIPENSNNTEVPVLEILFDIHPFPNYEDLYEHIITKIETIKANEEISSCEVLKANTSIKFTDN